MLGYPDFTKECILETDTSLKVLGAVLSQQDNTGKVHVTVYVSWTLRQSEQYMHNYRSAKQELLALKCDYLLGSKFMVYTDNNPLAYIHTSNLGVSQNHWLSNLVLFDFNIQHRLGKTNKAADALS